MIIDGKMQSAEVDEFIYHESLVHPPLLCMNEHACDRCGVDGCISIISPKTVFIMGGGEGSAAREVLRHNTVQRVVMCNIDQMRIHALLLHPWKSPYLRPARERQGQS